MRSSMCWREENRSIRSVDPCNCTDTQICNEENLRAVSNALKNVNIVCSDYTNSLSFIDKSTLVYLDPPYRPLKGRASFTSYTETVFNDSNQRELAGFIEEINSRGAYIILSNSDPKNSNAEDDFFDDELEFVGD